MKFVTGDQAGVIKIWNGMDLAFDMEIQVSNYMVMAMTFMTLSKKLVVATADRMISFYDLNEGSRRDKTPKSRFENLVAVPHCLEYYRRKDDALNKPKPKGSDGQDKDWLEKLLVGDDLGIIHMYYFTKTNWHYCTFKKYDRHSLECHKEVILTNYEKKIDKIV